MGLSPMEAIKTATINPARFFGRQNDFGSVEPGKFADLVILNDDPLDDITNTQNIYAVITNSHVLDGINSTGD